MLTKRALLAAGVYAVLAARAAAQEHEHGVDGLPDWYDKKFCCNYKDCAPIEDPDKDLQFVWFDPVTNTIEHDLTAGLDLEPAFLYKAWPGGLLFRATSFRQSLDERFHRCIFIPSYDEQEGDPVPEPQPRCLYIPGSV